MLARGFRSGNLLVLMLVGPTQMDHQPPNIVHEGLPISGQRPLVEVAPGHLRACIRDLAS